MDLIIIILFIVSICFVIAEIFGRSKHIGKGWAFFLLITSFVFGVIAIILSPSAKKQPTKGTNTHKIIGWILIFLGSLNVLMLNPISLSFIALGLYLIQLADGKIINSNPKYYFNYTTSRSSNQEHRAKTTPLFEQNSPEKNSNNNYFIIVDDEQKGPYTKEELRGFKINENDFVWRKGLDEWEKAKNLSELSEIILYNPPEFKKGKSNENNVNFKSEKIDVEPCYIFNELEYSKNDIEREFRKGNFFLMRNTKIKDNHGNIKYFQDIEELKDLLKYFPPTN